MTSHFALYDKKTGSILSIFSGDNESAALQGSPFIECDSGVTDLTHFVKDGALVKKEELDLRYEVDGLTVLFSSLPKGVVVTAMEHEIQTDGSSVEIEFEVPDSYEIEFSGDPVYRSETLEVTVG